MDETAGGNFRGKRSSSISYFMSFGIVYIGHLTKFANRSPLRLLSSGKFQTEKSPWTKKKKQTGPKKKEMTHFCVGKKKQTLFCKQQRLLVFLKLSCT
jgi:hypothetical protein